MLCLESHIHVVNPKRNSVVNIYLKTNTEKKNNKKNFLIYALH